MSICFSKSGWTKMNLITCRTRPNDVGMLHLKTACRYVGSANKAQKWRLSSLAQNQKGDILGGMFTEKGDLTGARIQNFFEPWTKVFLRNLAIMFMNNNTAFNSQSSILKPSNHLDVCERSRETQPISPIRELSAHSSHHCFFDS